MIQKLEEKIDKKLDEYGKKVTTMLKGYSILDPDKQTMTTKEVCEQYGVSERKLCYMREHGLIPFTKIGKGKNSKAIYRCVDVAEVFSSR